MDTVASDQQSTPETPKMGLGDRMKKYELEVLLSQKNSALTVILVDTKVGSKPSMDHQNRWSQIL